VEERITEANAKAKPKEVKQLAPLRSAFVRAGQVLDSKKVTKKEAPHLLQAANDWKFDLIYPSFALLALPMFSSCCGLDNS